MKLGILTDVSALQNPQWVYYDEEGFDEGPEEERVAFLIRPQTRTNLAIVERNAKKAELARKRSTNLNRDDIGGEGKGEAWVRELAKFLLVDWRNVVDGATHETLECSEKNKLLLFENTTIALWIIERAKELCSQKIEEETKNSNGSFDGGSDRPNSSADEPTALSPVYRLNDA